MEQPRILDGIETDIITGERSSSVSRRMEKLGIVECHLGARGKAAVVCSILKRLDLSSEKVGYLGQDVNDLLAFAVVGFTACPGDTLDEVKAAAHAIPQRPGGYGAFREFVEIVLKAREDAG